MEGEKRSVHCSPGVATSEANAFSKREALTLEKYVTNSFPPLLFMFYFPGLIF